MTRHRSSLWLLECLNRRAHVGWWWRVRAAENRPGGVM